MNPLILILVVVIILTWARLVRPGRTKLEGSRVATVPIPILARLRMHLVPGILAMAVALTLVGMDAAPWWISGVPALSYVVLVLLPVQYTLTTVGIRLGWTEFRRWTEFVAVRRAPGGARLIAMQRGRGLHVWLSGSRGDDEFIHFLKQTIRGAYKGDSTTIPVPRNQRGRTFVGGSEQVSSRVSTYLADRRRP